MFSIKFYEILWSFLLDLFRVLYIFFCTCKCFLFFFLFICFLFLAVLGLRFCVRAFSSCGKRGPLFIAVRRPLTVTASLVAEHRLQTCRLSSCGSQAQLLCGMWDLPRPGLEPMSPALAGGFLTTAPPGKPSFFFTLHILFAAIYFCNWSIILYIATFLNFYSFYLFVYRSNFSK